MYLLIRHKQVHSSLKWNLQGIIQFYSIISAGSSSDFFFLSANIFHQFGFAGMTSNQVNIRDSGVDASGFLLMALIRCLSKKGIYSVARR